MFKFLKEFFLNIGAGALINQTGDWITEGLEKFYEKDAEKCTALVQSFYAWIPVLVEIAAKSKTDLDDKLAAELISSIEEFAAAKGIELPAASAPVETQGDDNPPKGGEHPQDPPPNP